MDKNFVIKIVEEYVELLSANLELDEVFLYGSYARGNANEESDIDVAVVTTKPNENYYDVLTQLWKLRMKIDDRIEPMLFEKDRDPSGFLESIQKEGIRIYPAA